MKNTLIIILVALMAFTTTTAVASDIQVSVEQIKKQPKKKAEIKEVTFKVHLHCENCVKKVRENISFEKGVKDLHICMEDQIVAVKYDASKTNEETLKNAIVKLGVEVKGVSHEGHHHDHK
jgi:copper chaperone CopZ